MDDALDIRPWYREPMVWLLLALPLAVVVAGIATLVIAIRAGGTDAFPGQVRRTAQVQVEDLAPDRHAIALGLTGQLRMDPATGAVEVMLSGVPAQTQRLVLDLVHPARAAGDARVPLVRAGDRFLGRLEVPVRQVWSVQLRDAEGTWRIAGRYEPDRAVAPLAPALSEAR